MLNTGFRLSELVNSKWNDKCYFRRGARDRNLKVKESVLEVMRN